MPFFKPLHIDLSKMPYVRPPPSRVHGGGDLSCLEGHLFAGAATASSTGDDANLEVTVGAPLDRIALSEMTMASNDWSRSTCFLTLHRLHTDSSE